MLLHIYNCYCLQLLTLNKNPSCVWLFSVCCGGLLPHSGQNTHINRVLMRLFLKEEEDKVLLSKTLNSCHLWADENDHEENAIIITNMNKEICVPNEKTFMCAVCVSADFRATKGAFRAWKMQRGVGGRGWDEEGRLHGGDCWLGGMSVDWLLQSWSVTDQWFGPILSFHLNLKCPSAPSSLYTYMCVYVIQCTIEEMRLQEADFEAQMKEQCEEYKELLNEKMAREMEITAYRSVSWGSKCCEVVWASQIYTIQVTKNAFKHTNDIKKDLLMHTNTT